MPLDVLLTDDEIVALVAATRTPWPYGLPTVPADDRALTAAGLRGLRSLAVRGLARTGTAVEYSPQLSEAVRSAATAAHHVVAQVAVRESPAQPRGSAVGIFRAEDGWMADSVTLAGVHALRETTLDDAADLLLRFVTEVWENGVTSPGEDAAMGLYIATANPRAKDHFVTQGSTEAFVRDRASGFELPSGRHEDPWTLDDVRGLLAGP